MISGYEDIAQYLVDHNAKLDFIDFFGMTPIHYASENGEYAIYDVIKCDQFNWLCYKMFRSREDSGIIVQS